MKPFLFLFLWVVCVVNSVGCVMNILSKSNISLDWKQAPASFQILAKELKSKDKAVRWKAIQQIGWMGLLAKPMTPFLLEQMKDQDAVLREHTVWALEQLSDKQTDKLLQRFSKDTHLRVRKRIQKYLKKRKSLEDT